MSDDRQAKIEKRAREVWEREGCPDGRAEEHWRIAEGEIDAEAAAARKPTKPAAGKPAKAAGSESKTGAKTAESESKTGAKTGSKTAAKPKTAEPKAAKAAPKVKAEAKKAVDEAKKTVRKKK